MVVNDAKTSLICVSDPVSTDNTAYIRAGTERITAAERIKCLGFTFSSKPNQNLHVSNLVTRFRSRTWALRKLRRAGFKKDELVRFYKAAISPVAEYVAPAFHSLTPEYLSDALERQQTLALKNIYGIGMSSADMRSSAGLETLKKRRENATLKFAKKTAQNPSLRLGSKSEMSED